MVLTSLLTLFIVVSNVSISPSFSALFTSFSDFLKLTFDFFFLSTSGWFLAISFSDLACFPIEL